MPHDGVAGPHGHDHDETHDHGQGDDHRHAGESIPTNRAPTRRRVMAAGAGALLPLGAAPAEAQIVERMARLALDWLSALDERRRERAMVVFDGSERENWHYVPRSRRGLALRDMTEGQRARAMGLLESGLGSGGTARVQGVRHLEGLLRQRQGNWRDPDNYALAVFGSPGAYPWGWRFEGHHLSLNFTIVTPDRLAVTPAFWGANPARAPDGFRLMGAVEDLGRELISGLPDALRRTATIGDRSFGDIVAGPGRERDIGAPRGVALSEMDAAARNRALAIANGFLDALAPDIRAVQRRRIQEADAASLRFAWAGPVDGNRACYFRLHGATTLVELDNTQDDANHIHSVWRDLVSDFGRDALAEHYRRRRHR